MKDSALPAFSSGAVSLTDKPGRISSSIFKALLGRCGTLVLNCGTGILTARVLKPEGRGELAAMILWPVFLSGAFTLGLPSALIYTLKLKRSSSAVLVSTAILIGIILSVITACVGFMLLPRWLVHYPAPIVRSAQWFMISTPATIIVLIGRAAWEARGRFGISSASYLISPVGTLCGLALLWSMHRLTPINAAWCYVLAGIPPVVWVLGSVRRELGLRFGDMSKAAKDLMSYGLRSYGIDLCGSLSQYVDQALVLGMLAPAEMGTYTVALSLSRMINVVFTSTSAVIFPKSMEHDPEGSSRLAIRAVGGSLMLAIPAALVLLAGSAFALRILYGREYAVATGLLRVLILEAIISGCISVLSQPFMAIGRPGTVTVLQATGLAVSVPLIWVFVPIYGSKGAGIALLLSACLRGMLLPFCYRLILPRRTAMLSIAWSESKRASRHCANVLSRIVFSSDVEEAA